MSDSSLSSDKKRQRIFVDRLIEYFAHYGRSYSWRSRHDPYAILVAEMMLQRTKSDQVVSVYQKFLKRFPDPQTLASAPKRDVQKLLEPLGLRWRATMITKMGSSLVRNFDGEIPHSREELLTLPGVGAYAADAVLCYAYGEKVVPVDSNVCRVLRRIFNLHSKGEARRNRIFLGKVAELPVPKRLAKEFNWGLIDFGAAICTPRTPSCPLCPLNKICLYPNKTEVWKYDYSK